MRKIEIPERVLPGFDILSSFKKDDVDKLTSYLKNISINISLNSVPDELATLFDKETAIEVTKTLASFSTLLDNRKTTFEDIANDLSEAYNEQRGGNIEGIKLQTLKDNLLEVFNSYKNLRLSLKARDLLIENQNNFSDSRIISDLRIVFDEELENKKRHGVIVHQLHIRYRNDGIQKDIFLSLDASDLTQLKDEVERAIQKNTLIKNDYSGSIKIVF